MTRIKEFSHFCAIFLMVEVQLVMTLSAVNAEVVFRFGNFAFSTPSDSKPNVLLELIFIVFCLLQMQLLYCIF